MQEGSIEWNGDDGGRVGRKQQTELNDGRSPTKFAREDALANEHCATPNEMNKKSTCELTGGFTAPDSWARCFQLVVFTSCGDRACSTSRILQQHLQVMEIERQKPGDNVVVDHFERRSADIAQLSDKMPGTLDGPLQESLCTDWNGV